MRTVEPVLVAYVACIAALGAMAGCKQHGEGHSSASARASDERVTNQERRLARVDASGGPMQGAALGADAAVSAAAASDPVRLDATSPASFSRSLDRMKGKLGELESKEFEIALMAINLANEGDQEKVKQVVHGKTAREVVEYARRLE